jgi:hypothetical protein
VESVVLNALPLSPKVERVVLNALRKPLSPKVERVILNALRKRGGERLSQSPSEKSIHLRYCNKVERVVLNALLQSLSSPSHEQCPETSQPEFSHPFFA